MIAELVGARCNVFGDVPFEKRLENEPPRWEPSATEHQQTTDFSSQAPVEPLPPTLDSTASGGADASDAFEAPPAESSAPELRYALGKMHAEGGIGQVWLARDKQLHRDVAIKTIRPELLRHGRVRSRCFQEARITGQLEHPGIGPVYELITAPQSGSPFYSMRFVRGRTLDEAAREFHRARRAGSEDPLGLVSLLGAFVTVCNTVAYAHSRGVVHRDLKGENVLLGDFGEVFVLDWGVAKVLECPDEEGAVPAPILPLPLNASRTVQGDVIGTPAYMAPEQAEGRLDLVDRRTDIYGLGAILYEILTGEPPFSGSNTVEILDKVSREAPEPPSRLWPDVPHALEAACLRALSKNPADRQASAAEFGKEIQTWQEVRRREAEEELRRSRERFELAVRGSQDGLWDWDLERNEVYFSPRWKSILGYEDNELPNHLDEWVSRLHPDERDRVLAANYAHINGTTDHYEYEYRLRHKNGSYRWILARGVALRDENGKAYRMAGSHVDITAWKEMERALRESQRRCCVIVEAAPCGVLVLAATLLGGCYREEIEPGWYTSPPPRDWNERPTGRTLAQCGHEAGFVVRHGLTRAEALQLGGQTPDQMGRRSCGPREHRVEAGISKRFMLRVHGLGDAVGEQDQPVVRLQGSDGLLVRTGGADAERQPADRVQAANPTPAHEARRWMSGARVPQDASGGVVVSDKDRHVLAGGGEIACSQFAIDELQTGARGQA